MITSIYRVEKVYAVEGLEDGAYMIELDLWTDDVMERTIFVSRESDPYGAGPTVWQWLVDNGFIQ